MTNDSHLNNLYPLSIRDDLSIEKSIGGKKSIKSLFPPGANLVPSKGGVFSKSSIPDSREDSEHGEQVIMAFPVDSHTSGISQTA